MAQLSDDGEEEQYLSIPTNKPRHLITVDEAIGKIIKAAKLIKFQLDTPDDAYPMATLVVRAPQKDVGSEVTPMTFKGEGPSVGHAIREALDRMNVEFPLGGEYDDPQPPGA